jgi:hypothetical protein
MPAGALHKKYRWRKGLGELEDDSFGAEADLRRLSYYPSAEDDARSGEWKR